MAIIDNLRAASAFSRSAIRQGRTDGDPNMWAVRDHASTPSGRKEIEAIVADFARDTQTAMWLRTCLKQGDVRAAADTEARATIRAARVKERRSATMSSSTLSRSAPANLAKSGSLSSVYPDIAAQWDTEKNDGVGPDEVTPYINARVWWRCDQGHQWEARCNNRTNRAREGATPRCPECHGIRQQSLERMQDNLGRFVTSLDGDPEAWESLSPAMRHAILARTGMLDGARDSFDRNAAMSMVHGDVSLKDLISAKEVADLDGRVEDDLGDEDDATDNVIDNLGDIANPAATDNFGPAALNDRLDKIMASSGTAGLVPDDTELAAMIAHENVEALFNECYNNPDRVDAILDRVRDGADRNPYRAALADEFGAQLDRTRNYPLPDGYQVQQTLPDGTVVDMEPNLAQRRTMLKVLDDRAHLNLSGTGAGKTLGGALAIRAVGAQETLITCPAGAVMDQWKHTIQQAYPDTEVRFGLPELGEDLDATRTGKPRVFVVNYDKFSQPGAAERLTPLAERLDAAVLDEIHQAKQADPNQRSTRSGVLEKALDTARANNPELAVLAQSATPVTTTLEEPKALVRMVTGEAPAGMGTAPTMRNATNCYRVLSQMSTRWRPNYQPVLKRPTLEIDITDRMPSVLARIEQMERAKPGSASNPSTIERALLSEKMGPVADHIKKTGRPHVVYSEYTTGMVDPVVNRLRTEGLTAERYTGQENAAQRKDLLRRFQSGEINVLVGSKPIATGVDGLQRVCADMTVISGPWTNTQDEQLIGRVNRQGQGAEKVNITHVVTKATVGKVSWSYDEERRSRVAFRRSLSDAAVDGVIPEGELGSATSTAARGVESLRAFVSTLAEQTQVAA